jgi:hypothetical protein
MKSLLPAIITGSYATIQVRTYGEETVVMTIYALIENKPDGDSEMPIANAA